MKRSDHQPKPERVSQGTLSHTSEKVPIELYSEDRIAEFSQDEEVIGDLIPDD